mmetsp:Transcript_2756/g.5917  ORF Transcript_2756/g.5917 Transcript_2756/m.5917 type:complete len:309 (+) Transcript_2756:2366-3292(+)
MLERLEFFPISCRIQRAVENFKRHTEVLNSDPGFWRHGVGGRRQHNGGLSTKIIFFWLLMARRVAEDCADCKTRAVSAQLQLSSIAYNLLDLFKGGFSCAVPRTCQPSEPQPTMESLSTLSNDESTIEGIEAPVELSVRQKEQIQSAFTLFDTDGSGSMDEEELDAAMLALGFDAGARQRATSRHSRGGEASLDRSSAGNCINIANFTALMQGELTRRSIREEIATLFSRLIRLSHVSPGANVCKSTTDCAGQRPCVTVETLRRACAALGVQLDDDELQRMISEADRDGNGAVSEEEFVRIMQHSCWF